MIDFLHEDLFEVNSVEKQYSIAVYNGDTLETTITNAQLYSEDFELTKTLCSENGLRYGSCESASVKFKVVNTVGTLKGKKIIISCTLDEYTQDVLQIGEFYVDSDKLSGDRKSREIIAYDKIYTIVNTDMLKWYKELGFPVTMSYFRSAFLSYFGITQESVTLVNDTMVITDAILAEQLTGIEILNAILAGNGCLGFIDNTGTFRYVFLNDYDTKAYGKNYKQGSLKYEDYNVRPLTALTFYSNNDIVITIGTTEGNGANTYIMEDNFLFYDKPVNVLQGFVQNIYDVIVQTPAFKVLSVETYGDFCVELGDYVTFTNESNQTLGTFVMQKKIKGLQSLMDEFDTEGTEYFEYDLNGGNSQIRRLWNNTITIQTELNSARTYVYAQRPSTSKTITSSAETEIINIQFATVDDTIPVFVATVPLTMSLDGEVIFRYYLDGVKLNANDEDTLYLTKGEQFATISTFFEAEANARYTFTVTAQAGYRESEDRKQTAKILSLKDWIDNQTITVSGGTATFDYDYVEQDVDDTPPTITIGSHKIRAVIFASGLASTKAWDGTLILTDTAIDFTLEDTLFDVAVENVSVNAQNPISNTLSETVSDIELVDVIFASAIETVMASLYSTSYRRITENGDTRKTEEDDTRYTEGD